MTEMYLVESTKHTFKYICDNLKAARRMMLETAQGMSSDDTINVYRFDKFAEMDVAFIDRLVYKVFKDKEVYVYDYGINGKGLETQKDFMNRVGIGA